MVVEHWTTQEKLLRHRLQHQLSRCQHGACWHWCAACLLSLQREPEKVISLEDQASSGLGHSRDIDDIADGAGSIDDLGRSEMVAY